MIRKLTCLLSAREMWEHSTGCTALQVCVITGHTSLRLYRQSPSNKLELLARPEAFGSRLQASGSRS